MILFAVNLWWTIPQSNLIFVFNICSLGQHVISCQKPELFGFIIRYFDRVYSKPQERSRLVSPCSTLPRIHSDISVRFGWEIEPCLHLDQSRQVFQAKRGELLRVGRTRSTWLMTINASEWLAWEEKISASLWTLHDRHHSMPQSSHICCMNRDEYSSRGVESCDNVRADAMSRS